MWLLFDQLKELTGIYRLGFERESFMGLVLPIIFVIVVGGIGAWIILH
jgi:hypothetical protein